MESKISKGTIIRTILLVVSVINGVLALSGKSPLPFDEEAIEMVVSYGFTIIMAFLTWWKNNSFTKNARKADELLKKLKANHKLKRKSRPAPRRWTSPQTRASCWPCSAGWTRRAVTGSWSRPRSL